MTNTDVMRASGPTYCLDLTTSASSALQIVPVGNVNSNYVCLMMTGTGVAGIEFSKTSTVATPAIASTGNSGSFVILPGIKIIIAVPEGAIYLKAISSGTNTLYITPVQAD